MRRIFLFFVFLLTACSSPTGSLPASAATPTLIASLASATPLPTRTPGPPTITPLPTIPTFTPTFDARTILTATPAPKAECPKLQPDLQIKFPLFETAMENDQIKTEEIVSDFLNQGGTFKNLLQTYKTQKDARLALSGQEPQSIDITNDGVPEILATYPNQANDLSNTALHIFTCAHGKFTDIFQIKIGLGEINELVLKDLNKDGVPEIILITRAIWAEIAGAVEIVEWDGNEFRDLITAPYSPAYELVYRRGSLASDTVSYKEFIRLYGLEGDATFSMQDVDNDGVSEVIINWRHISYSDGPSRDPTLTVKWDGKHYVIARVKYPHPQFRFQAIQDADDAAQFNEFDDAISLYQDAIFSTKLDWYTVERQDTYGCCRKITPVPDETEYPRLAAYAYYRMIALHTYLGQTAEAEIKYATLQAKFPAGNPGHPYVEMANAFWDAYQSSQKMYNACAAAIAYADAHPEILIPLGSDYHGWQSHIYTPADVCPFR